MGIFSRLFNLQDDHVDFQIAKNMLAGMQATFNYPSYPSHVGHPLLTELFQQKDEFARNELSLFLEGFLKQDISQLKIMSQGFGNYASSGINIRLLQEALVKFVPLAITGRERKISMLLQQGKELSTEQRTFYIQRDISDTMQGAGSADQKLEDHQVITLASYLLLKHLIALLVQQSGKHGSTWLREMAWYFGCVFAFWMQYSAENNIVGKYYDLYMSGIRPSKQGD
ncbi:MAG TPA: hypothetical protein VMW30_07045 [Candidatus Paceibacterota bacterium]|nr:hypothetical protein [Candidatus Paceibacterota bacterium]